MPRSDPVSRPQFGGTQGELETIASYREAIRKLEKARFEPGGHKKGAGKDKEDGDGK